MQNTIWPSHNGNFTVVGKYPYNLPKQVRQLFCENTLDFYVLVKLSTGDYIASGFRTKEFAELGIANMQPNTLVWLVYPSASV